MWKGQIKPTHLSRDLAPAASMLIWLLLR
jgi:hypothetical protein